MNEKMGGGREDVIIVVRCYEKDVARLRKLIHGDAVTQDVVFRRKPSRFNYGVDLFTVINEGLDRIMSLGKRREG